MGLLSFLFGCVIPSLNTETVLSSKVKSFILIIDWQDLVALMAWLSACGYCSCWVMCTPGLIKYCIKHRILVVTSINHIYTLYDFQLLCRYLLSCSRSASSDWIIIGDYFYIISRMGLVVLLLGLDKFYSQIYAVVSFK